MISEKRKEQMRLYQEANREKLALKQKESYEKNKVKIRAQHKIYWEKNKSWINKNRRQ
jgi:hypothetical protein|tara:strand:- start:576 stop:749 length:174 start_codon:yes stop_codon:yes gene_type:complete